MGRMVPGRKWVTLSHGFELLPTSGQMDLGRY